MITKLQTIQKSLKTNPRVVIGKFEKYDELSANRFFNWFPLQSYTPNGFINIQNVYYTIAPKKGLYQAEQLNDFKKDLVRELPFKPDYDRCFELTKSGPILYLGRLGFIEEIATEKAHCNRDIELIATDLIKQSALKRFKNGLKKVTHDRVFHYTRNIEIAILPDRNMLSAHASEKIGCKFIIGGDIREMFPKAYHKMFD